MKILSHTNAKKKTKRLKGWKNVHFGWSFSSDIMAVKGTNNLLNRLCVYILFRSFDRFDIDGFDTDGSAYVKRLNEKEEEESRPNLSNRSPRTQHTVSVVTIVRIKTTVVAWLFTQFRHEIADENSFLNQQLQTLNIKQTSNGKQNKKDAVGTPSRPTSLFHE